MNLQYIATCPAEIQSIVTTEVKRLKGKNIQQKFKAVAFEANEEDIYRMHLHLRTPSRLLQVVKAGSGSSLAIITNQARKVDWSKYLGPHTSFLIEGVAGDRGPKSPTATTISKAVRLGLEDYFNHKGLTKPPVDLKEPKVKIIAFVHQKRLTISIDTTGKALHKRGYRRDLHPAPLKETLAASLLVAAGYDGSQNFFDPMCGSGTLAIEASYIALQKAPLIHRKRGEFFLENLKGFNYQLWRDVQDEARSQRIDAPPANIYAADIDASFTAAARNNALRARVEKHISLQTQDFIGSKPPCEPGLLITNLPYGERIDSHDHADMKEFYREFGNTLKRNYSGWKAVVLAASDAPYKHIGLRPEKKMNILNGSIPCKLLFFDLYAGSKKMT